MQTTNPIGQRRNNLAVLARAIWKTPGISRRELVDHFEIDESSVSRLVSQLIQMGLVESSGTVEGSSTPGPAPGGRRRIALKVREDFGQVWGLALWRDRVRVTVINMQGQSLATQEFPLQPYDGDWKAYLQRAVHLAVQLSARTAAAQAGVPRPLMGIGLGMPGWVDSELSMVVRSDEFGLRQVTCPVQWPEHLPVLWENDANCGAWSGLGRGAPTDDELYVIARFLENGPLGLPSELSVGFGLIVNGQLHRGWRHAAGEFISALWKPGCSSAYGLDDYTFGRSRIDKEAFLATVGEVLRNLRFATELLDPHTIHLGGDLKDRFDDVKEACDLVAWPAGKALLHPLPAGIDEVSLGAALLVLDELFQFPSGDRLTLFRGYGTGVNDPVWRGLPSGLESCPAVK
ncbi:MAG: ROK family transcriptional regulator [Spirochaetales bacterium]